MSRIYEALQKAEAERGSGNHPEPHRGESASRFPDHHIDHHATAVAEPELEPLLDHPGDPGLQAFEPAAAPPRFSPSTAEPGRYTDTLPTRVPGLDLETLPQQVWAPNFERLPAVLERGSAVEQFRSLRSRLYEIRDKHPLRTVLVTSGLPQEGKSFVSTNLAISLARNKNARVLLIDGDMRRYTVHQVLGCRPDPGLADFLAGRATLPEIMQRCDPAASRGLLDGTPVHLPPLALIAGGNGGDNAADLSNNNRFEELIGTVSPLFDWIIVDSSPVLPVSDAVNLSRSCDGVLVVARSGRTEYEDAQRTLSELKSAHLLGFVLNGAQAVSDKGGYYGYSSTRQSSTE